MTDYANAWLKAGAEVRALNAEVARLRQRAEAAEAALAQMEADREPASRSEWPHRPMIPSAPPNPAAGDNTTGSA